MKQLLSVVLLICTLSVGSAHPTADTVLAGGPPSDSLKVDVVAMLAPPCTFLDTLVANATGGTAPYTYDWSTSDTTPTVIVPGGGTYTVTVTDAAGKTASQTYSLTTPAPVYLWIGIGYTLCATVSTGSINILQIQGGTPPYTVQWHTGATGNSITGLTAGTYSCTIRDSLGCTSDMQATVGIVATYGPWVTADVSSVSCHGDSDGVISIEPFPSASPPFTYVWNTGDTTPTIGNLTPGFYSVTVTEGNGCTTVKWSEVEGPDSLGVVVNSVPPTGAAANGSVSLQVTGGTSPFTYHWADLPNAINIYNKTRINMAAGQYTVTVVDANHCELVLDILLGTPLSTQYAGSPAAEIRLSPNPTFDGHFAVDMPVCPTDCELLVYDAWGRRMRQITVPAGSTRVEASLDHLPAGPYRLQLAGLMIGTLLRQ